MTAGDIPGADVARAGEREQAPAHQAGSATWHLCAAAHLRGPMLPRSAQHRVPVGSDRRNFLRALGADQAKPPAVGRAYTRRFRRQGRLLTLEPGIDIDHVRWHCRLARSQLWARDIVIGVLSIITGLAVLALVVATVIRLAPRFGRKTLLVVGAVFFVLIAWAARLDPRILLVPICGAAGCWVAFFADSLLERHRFRHLMTSPCSWAKRQDARHVLRIPPWLGVRFPRHENTTAGGECNVLPYGTDRIVGSGIPYNASTITVAVDKPAPGATAEHFEARHLLAYIADHADRQGQPHELTHGVPRLEVRPVLAVPAPLWRIHVLTVPERIIYAFADSLQSGAVRRPYVQAQAVTWDGQLVVTLYVAIALEGRYLRVTVLPHVLHPIVKELRLADALAERNIVVHAGYAAADAVRECGRLLKWLSRETEIRREWKRKEHRRTDLVSLREHYSQDDHEDIAQRDDALRIINVIEMRVFDVTERFLRALGIDTQEFATQVQQIIQNSVIVQGDVSGNIQNVNGAGASATNNQSKSSPGPKK